MPSDHLVPEFYLRNFGNDLGQVSVKSAIGVSKSNVRSALIIQDFYSDSIDKKSFEAHLQITESRTAPVIKKIISSGARSLNEIDSLQIFEFACSSYLRSFRSRNLTSNLAEIMKRTDFLEVRNQLDGTMSAKHRGSLDQNDRVVTDFQHSDPSNDLDPQIMSMHFESYKHALLRAKHTFDEFELNLIDFNRKRLITCDSPTVLFSDSGRTSSFDNAEQIYLPLSPKVALFYFRRGSKSADKIWVASTVLQELFNDSIALNARYGLVSHPEDDVLIRTRQINSNRLELNVEHVIDQFNRPVNSLTQ